MKYYFKQIFNSLKYIISAEITVVLFYMLLSFYSVVKQDDDNVQYYFLTGFFFVKFLITCFLACISGVLKNKSILSIIIILLEDIRSCIMNHILSEGILSGICYYIFSSLFIPVMCLIILKKILNMFEKKHFYTAVLQIIYVLFDIMFILIMPVFISLNGVYDMKSFIIYSSAVMFVIDVIKSFVIYFVFLFLNDEFIKSNKKIQIIWNITSYILKIIMLFAVVKLSNWEMISDNQSYSVFLNQYINPVMGLMILVSVVSYLIIKRKYKPAK